MEQSARHELREAGRKSMDATVQVAAANARRNFEGEVATLYDLQPEQRPDLVVVVVQKTQFVDALTPQGLRSLRLPASYPRNVPNRRCQRIAKRAYDSTPLGGIACRSNAKVTPPLVGEELAVFDRALVLVIKSGA